MNNGFLPFSVGGPGTTPPSGWSWFRLTDRARLESGHTPSRRRPEWWGGDIPWIALPDIRALDGKVALKTAECTNQLGIANSSARVLPTGTVVLSRTASVGFVTVMGCPMATSQDFVNWVCGDELDPHYLALVLRAARDHIRAVASGAVHKTVYMPTVESFFVAAPDLSGQRRLVNRAHKALEFAERARSAATAQADLAALLPDRLLRAAFHDVVPIQTASGASNPPGWRWLNLKSIARLESGHTPRRSRADWWGGDIPWIALPDIRALDGRVAVHTAETTNDAGIANSSARVLPTNTVVMSRTASVGFVTIMGRPMATSQDFVNWVCGPDIDPSFLAHALRASREYVRGLASGAIHKTVYMPTLSALHVCAPSIDEQRRIAEELDIRLADAARLATRLSARRDAIAALPVSILRSAFITDQSVQLRRGAIASYLVHRLHHQPTFGRVMLQKMLYLAEAHVGVDLEGEYQRRAAGPHSPSVLREIETVAAEQGWFSTRKEAGRYVYTPGPNIMERVSSAAILLGERRRELDRLISIFGGRRTEIAEMIATLFAAWNDFLIDRRTPSDDTIVTELHTNWHERKRSFGADRLRRALQWMRENDVVPRGRGPRTEVVHA